MSAKPPGHSSSDLDPLLNQMKPETFHEEVDFGPDVGRDISELEEIQAGLDEAERGAFASDSEVAAVFGKYKP